MMSVELGPVPVNENCQQVGTPNYDHDRARKECEVFRDLIRRTVGEEPAGARLVVKDQYHDFGNYYEVVCKFDENNTPAEDYAFRCEEEAPVNWDEQAKKELGID